MIIKNNFPIKLMNNRVWRVYLGGKMLNKLYGGNYQVKNGHFPEEWIASSVTARNIGREHIEDEGLSKLAVDSCISLRDVIESNPRDFLGEKHFEHYQNSMGVLLKLIDSAERLSVQVHPDKIKAKELFESSYGKTECWHILGGQELNGGKPHIYFGFKEGITKGYWKKLFEEQNIEEMLNCMHKYEVSKGDTILIEGGIPHAIGSGCFLVEIQEPTDYTIRVEKTTVSGYSVDDFMCHQGLGFEKMFDCFNYNGLSKEDTYKRWFIQPNILEKQEGGAITSLISYDNTTLFKMNKLDVTGQLTIILPDVFSVVLILSGHGKLEVNGKLENIKQGEQYFIPAGVDKLSIHSGDDPIQAVHCFGPEL